jgi:hypothetical protein
MPFVVPDDYYSNGTCAYPEQQMIWKASHIGPLKPTNVKMELLRLCCNDLENALQFSPEFIARLGEIRS